MRKSLLILISLLSSAFPGFAQLKWKKVDALYQPLPKSINVYYTTDSLEGKPNIAYYVIAGLKDRKLKFTADTTLNRRLTPQQFYEKNNQPLLVVNCTFFSFQTHQNLNVVIKEGKLVGYNVHAIPGRGKDTLTYWHPFRSAIGMDKNRNADVAWIYSDSSLRYAFASQHSVQPFTDSMPALNPREITGKKYTYRLHPDKKDYKRTFAKWKMQTAVGGGPVLLQNGEIKITHEEERLFAGNAINDRHPRTAMGYTKDNKLIILVVQGRTPGIAEGATLTQLAQIFKDLGCREALNLDGGGSSCMLINGKETIKPSDATGQRPVPAVFIIK
jgi:hypothetical protein